MTHSAYDGWQLMLNPRKLFPVNTRLGISTVLAAGVAGTLLYACGGSSFSAATDAGPDAPGPADSGSPADSQPPADTGSDTMPPADASCFHSTNPFCDSFDNAATLEMPTWEYAPGCNMPDVVKDGEYLSSPRSLHVLSPGAAAKCSAAVAAAPFANSPVQNGFTCSFWVRVDSVPESPTFFAFLALGGTPTGTYSLGLGTYPTGLVLVDSMGPPAGEDGGSSVVATYNLGGSILGSVFHQVILSLNTQTKQAFVLIDSVESGPFDVQFPAGALMEIAVGLPYVAPQAATLSPTELHIDNVACEVQ